jgi:glycine oxidase
VQATVVGAGVAGLTCALELASRGVEVEIYEQAQHVGAHACSWYAGGMLAPWCELESSEPLIAALGEESLQWWRTQVPGVIFNGTLVLASDRDAPELTRFVRRTTRRTSIDRDGIAALEPDLGGRFRHGLFFADEGHLDPRAALLYLTQRLQTLGTHIHFGVTADVEALTARSSSRWILDCTGLAARHRLRELRGVKGEMLLLQSSDLSLSRPVRLLHPRIPVYVVPRSNGAFMVGATMIESDDRERITARSMLELLSAAYALHPAFGEAEIVEIGTQVRPAFTDNLPRIIRKGRVLSINGFYRHGYCVAPALARRAADVILHDGFFPEVMHEDSRERCLA